jgi:hypothetical protein
MEFSVTIKTDEDGYTGRECPACEKYFKIKFGTGLPDATDCHCPYCNHIGPQNEFWTKQQIEHAKSVALNKISGDLLKQMKKMERRPNRNAFISIGITVKGRPTPIAYYSEKELEEHVTCNVCTLEYTIYGAFGYCPDCGVHNSQQIVNANFDLALKILDLASSADGEIKDKLIENALEDAVSAFDGFGREHCSNLAHKFSFQNIAAARDTLLREERVDITVGLTADRCNFVCEQFQKRHLLAHKMGIVDEEFIRKTGHSPSLIGRKVSITENDVRALVGDLKVMVGNLFNGVTRS